MRQSRSAIPDDNPIAQLLGEMKAGDGSAAARLLPLVYEELRRLAGAYLAAERRDHTLQPTALVHEAFLRLVREPEARWEDKTHFYRVAALAMRRVLVNHARDRKRIKRCAPGEREPLESIDLADDASVDLVALDDALARLGQLDGRKEQVVQMRYFGGFSVDETARMLDISPAQVKRDWTLARAFLLRELNAADAPDAAS